MMRIAFIAPDGTELVHNAVDLQVDDLRRVEAHDVDHPKDAALELLGRIAGGDPIAIAALSDMLRR